MYDYTVFIDVAVSLCLCYLAVYVSEEQYIFAIRAAIVRQLMLSSSLQRDIMLTSMHVPL